MGTQSKGRIKAMVAKEMQDIYNRGEEVKKSINDNLQNVLKDLHSIIAQIPQLASGPLIPKTPKVLRKKGLQVIDTIPEDDMDSVDCSDTENGPQTGKVENKQLEETLGGRSRREASIKAATNIRKQQTMQLKTKLRRETDSTLDNPQVVITQKLDNKLKRKKAMRNSSDEENSQGPSKHSKTEDSITIARVKTEVHSGIHGADDECTVLDTEEKFPAKPKYSTRTRTPNHNNEQSRIKSNIVDDTFIAPTRDDMEEASMYEDAISKPTPMMNSTMNLNATVSLQKMMNATVVLEQLPLRNLNETVTIQKKISAGTKVKKSSIQKPKANEEETVSKSFQDRKVFSPTSQPLQDRMQQLKSIIPNELNELLTDDESSPEAKKPRRITKKQDEKKKRRWVEQIDTSSEDEVLDTPQKSLREVKAHKTIQEIRNGYKSNALFSPYAKESVKKRVEAFEQAGMHSPKPTADIEIPTRVTRTKTRAIAAAEAEALESKADKEKTITRNLARKSIAKAKKISLAKRTKDLEDHKENIPMTGQKQIKMISNEKITQKIQLKTTPLTKSKTQLPVSVNRLQQTPSNSQYPPGYGKALSATSSNIVTNMDSFLQHPRTATATKSSKKGEEKKRKLSEDDARKKREDALRVQTEEKRRKRQEKEIKIKLAREAKEKLELERREKAEREREEKARLAQQMQEKQREELEKKRVLQQQRQLEKEERRKMEEHQRLLRLQEQEEAQRLLAEQKRREMEAEKRKEGEARAHQQAAAEALKMRPQMLASEAKHAKQMMKQTHANNKHHAPTNYILDSEPDDDASDDEARPKHVIPYWAQSDVRKGQLEMQRYIPMSAVNKFFDAKKSTPDLADFFHGIDRRKLQRTSSAIWKTPPRYSMMENVNY